MKKRGANLPTAGSAPIALLSIGIIGLGTAAVISAFASGRVDQGLQNVTVLLGIPAATLVLASTYGAAASLRAIQMRRIHSFVGVYSSVRSDELVSAIGALRIAERRSIAMPPFAISIAATTDGVEVWAGLFLAKRLYSIPWSSVTSVTADVIDRPSWKGIAIGVAAADAEVRLPFALFGGLFGIFAIRATTATAIARNLEEVRTSAKS